MISPTISDMMAAYAEDAVDSARQRFDISLDYSHARVELVESIADERFQSRPKGLVGKLFRKSPSEEEIQTLCKMLGGYIGEVLRRNKGGNWAVNQEYSTSGIRNGDTWLLPPAKVRKRLTNGAEDDLWSYFRAVVDQPWVG